MEFAIGNCRRRWSAVLLALCALGVWIGCLPLALSQPALLGQWPEVIRGAEAQSVFVANGVAYVAGGSKGLFIVNVAEASRPQLIGQLNTSGFSKDVVVVGTVAYIADSENGLVIADVTDPANPVNLARLDTDGMAEAVSVSGNIACVADGMSGLVVVDVSNPASPVRKGVLASQGRAGGISISGTRAYVAEGTAGLQVYDVSNPAAPVRLGGLDTPGFAHSVQVVGTLAYVADGSLGIRIVDCTVPAAPTTLGVLATPGVAMDIQVLGGVAAVAAGESGLVMVNVSNPSAPSLSGTLATRGASFGVFLGDAKAYVADIHSGILVADVAVPATPNRVGRLAITGETQGVQIAGTVGYLADWNGGMVILDVSNPGLPKQIGGYGSGTSVSDLIVNGTVAYVGDYRDGLVVLDISDPTAPVRIGGYAAVSQVIDLELVGTRLYIAHGTGVEILDVSTPTSPVRLGGYATDGDAFRVKVVGSVAYVGIRDSVVRPAFQILNVANPSAPGYLGGFRTGSDVSGISIVGNLAYLATLDGGVQILNIATPATITRLATVATAGNARAIDVQATTAFVAEDTAGLGTFSVQDSANVGRTSLTNTRGNALGFQIASGTAYVADGAGGLAILSQAAPVNTPPIFGAIGVQQADEGVFWQLTVAAQDFDVPANVLSYVLLDGPAGMSMSAAGVLTWTPGESVGPATNLVTVAVYDNGLPPLSATNQFPLVVREVNRPPQLPSLGTLQISELVPWNFQLSAVDPDIPSNQLSYALISGPNGLSVSSSGLVSWTPGETQGPSVSKVVIRVADDGIPSLSVTNEFAVSVTEVNSAPFLVPVANQFLQELVPFSLNLNGGDLDFPANNLEFSLVSGPLGMQVSPGGVLTWTPSEDQGPSTNSVLVGVRDDGNPRLSATNEFTVVVSEVNSPPVLSSVAPVTVDELTTLAIQLSSEDGDIPQTAMTYAAVSVPDGMTVSPSGAVSWTPSEAQGPSTNTVVVRVTDGGVPPLSATNQFTVVVREVNVAPVMDPVPLQTVTERESLVLTLSGSDSDVPANGLVYGLVRGPAGLTISPTGSVAWTPSEDQGPSTNTVIVQLADDANPSLSVTNEFTVVVREVNSPPTFRPATPVTGDELAHLTIPLEVIDEDVPANGMTFSIISGPPGLTVTEGGIVDWTPTEEQGPMVATVVIRVTDDGIPPLSATNQFTITVNEVNSAPVMVPVAEQVVDALVPLGLFLTGSDLDRPANSLTYDLVLGPAGLTVSATGAVAWKPSADQVPSTNTVVIRVTDDGVPALSATNQFTVVALEVEERSVIQVGVDDDPAKLPYAPLREFQVQNNRNDPPPGAVTRLPGDPLFDAANNPGADDDFYVRGIFPRGFNGLTDRLVVPNDEPSMAWERALTLGDLTNRLHFRLTEAQGSPGTWIRVVAEFSNAGSLIAGQPVPGFSEHEVALRFRNGAGEVTPLKSMRFTSATVMTAEFSVADVGALPGGNSIEFVRTGPVVPGISYWVAFDYVRVEIDSGGNQAPVFSDVGHPEVDEGSPLVLNLSAVDGDEPPTPLVYELVSGPRGMTVSTAGEMRWTPGEDQGPSESPVVVKVTDQGIPAKSATNSFVVVVREVNRAPTLPPVGDRTVAELETLEVDLLALDEDLPGNNLQYELLRGPAGMTVRPDGKLLWTPTEEQGPSENEVVVKVSDGGEPNLSATNRFFVTVSEVNQPPSILAVPEQIVDSLTPLDLILPGMDHDIPPNGITFELLSGPAGLTVSRSGVLSWHPGPVSVASTNEVVIRVTDDGVPAASSINHVTVVRLPVEERAVIQLGVDDDPNVLPYVPYQEFQAQNNRFDPPPGSVTRLPGDPLYDPLSNPGQDDDFYVRGIYGRGFNGLTDRLTVPNDEPASAWEHSLTIGDPTNRLNFRLTEAQADPATWIRVVAEFATGGEVGPDNALRGFGNHEVVFRFRNAAGRVTTLKSAQFSSPTVMTAEFSVADVGALPGGNSIEFVRTGPSVPGVSYWVTFDYVRVEIDSGGNQAPVFSDVGHPEVDEGSPLVLNLSAVDGDEPPTPLVYELVSGPRGMTVSTAGEVRWTPGEDQGPSESPVVVKVTDQGIPAKSATNSFVVVVREVNRAPTLPPVGDRTVAELETLEVDLLALDEDLPGNNLQYELLRGPVGMTVRPDGKLLWTPTEEQGPSENEVVVKVSDGGEPNLSATNRFFVTVSEVNHPPLFLEISDQTIPELQPFEFSLSALDSDIPINTLEYSLIRGPVGLKVSPQGVLTWTPSEAQGPSTNIVMVQVKDDGRGALTATNQFTIVVLEINSPPVLFPIGDVEVPLGESVLIPLDVSDEDEPGQDGFDFRVLTGDPSAFVDSVARVFEWTASSLGDHSFEVEVGDSGLPKGRDRQRFTVHVLAPVLMVRIEEGRVFVEFETLPNWNYQILGSPCTVRAESREYWGAVLPSPIHGTGSRITVEVPVGGYEWGELFRLEALEPPAR